MGVTAWVVGLGCGAVMVGLFVRAFVMARRRPGPADLVTIGRGLVACAVAALTVELWLGHDVAVVVAGLAAPALALDAVDGQVARRTGTVSALGARLDGEVDAFLILVLSVAVAPALGWWVLAGGLARYLFGAAGWALPWLRGPLAFRYWRKVVTATAGIALTVAVADVLPRAVALAAVGVAHLLLAESFGRDVWSLWRGRERAAVPRGSVGGGASRVASVGAALLMLAVLWFALVAPNQPRLLTPSALLRLPAEVVVVAALALVVPVRRLGVVVGVAGSVLGVITLLKGLDLAAFTVLDRPFNLVTDRGLVGSGVAFVRDSWGPWAAAGGVVGLVVLLGLALLGPFWAVGRLTNAVVRHRDRGIRVVVGVSGAWLLLAVTGLGTFGGAPLAVSGAAPYLAGKAEASVTAYRDRELFERALEVDTHRTPTAGELSGLAGKDVLIVFVESYGRVALEGAGSQPVAALLDDWTARLRRLGLTARSGYLTSPTFGGSSWLAHSTLQSGLPVTDQSRYDRLLTAERTTLTSAFSRAGWRTVAVLPSTHGSWPEGRAFYGLDAVHDGSGLGYAGPRFGFSAVPDQFALEAFARRELGEGRSRPVMAAIELTSSHGPWAPLPRMVAPAALGDGSVYREMKANAVTAAELWRDRSAVPPAYRTSIGYSLTCVLSFVEERAADDLVLVVLGDHQPATIVSGSGGSWDVPVSVIARDPVVVARIADWGWTDGLRPDAEAPVWPMAAFRDRFLAAYGAPYGPGDGAVNGGAGGVVPAEARP